MSFTYRIDVAGNMSISMSMSISICTCTYIYIHMYIYRMGYRTGYIEFKTIHKLLVCRGLSENRADTSRKSAGE